jgi:guanylate kinase
VGVAGRVGGGIGGGAGGWVEWALAGRDLGIAIEAAFFSLRSPSMSADTPEHRLATDTEDGLLLIISGPSGVGKTTVTRGVERALPGSVFSVSATTRAKTAADVEGVDYHFVSDEQFQQMEAAGEFLETAGIYGKRYGTPRAWVAEQLRRGRVVILEIDVQGAVQVKSRVPGALAIYILPPSEEVLLERLRSRKRDDAPTIQRRFAEAKREIQAARDSGVYSSFLVNEQLEETIRRAVEIVEGRR